MADKYDLLIIGAGPGGYVAASRAGLHGLKTLIVEDRALGGTCLNWGCIPAKAMIEAAARVETVEAAGDFGVNVKGFDFDYAKAVERTHKVVDRLTRGVGGLMKARKVEVAMGVASFTGENAAKVVPNDGGDAREVRFDKCIIATGSMPNKPGFLPWDDKRVMTTDEVFDWTEKPSKVVVLGGGVIGCEFVSMFSGMGFEVAVVEMMDRLLPMLDTEMGKAMKKAFKKRKVTVKTGAKLESVDTKGKTLTCKLDSGDTLEGDILLVSVGRHANTDKLNLEAAGLSPNDRKVIGVNEYAQTSKPHIYAIGDVNGLWQLAHVASHQGLVAVDHIRGGTRRIDNDTVPDCIYTHPQAAEVGLSEEAAREAGYEAHSAKFQFAANGRALTAGHDEGYVKIVGVKRTGRILGAQIVGPETTELIAPIAVAMRNQLTVKELAHTIFAHPTLSEAVMEAAENFLGEGVHSV